VLNEESAEHGRGAGWKRIVALIVIFLIVIVFWMIFHQNSHADVLGRGPHPVDLHQGGRILSNAINAIWIVVLSLPLAWFWGWLDKRPRAVDSDQDHVRHGPHRPVDGHPLFRGGPAHGFDKPAFRVEKPRQRHVGLDSAKEAREHLA
jgi:hypothetical protein